MPKPLLLKEIKILPSAFKLDIIICSDLKKVAQLAHKRYGATVEWYENNLVLDSCCDLRATKDSELKGHLRTLVILERKKLDIVAHELIHAMWYLAQNIGYEMTFETQEWQAVMYEYLLKEAMGKDYVKY